MKNRYWSVLAAGLTLLLATAPQNIRAETATAESPAVKAEQSPQNVSDKADKMAGLEKPPLTGKVLVTMNASGYTYIFLEKDGKKGWIAVPPATVTVGQEVQAEPGLEMGLFVSKALKLSFDNIVFSPGLVTGAKDAAAKTKAGTASISKQPASHPGAKNTGKPKAMAAMFSSAGGDQSGTIRGKVVETKDAGGYTYVNLEKDGKQTWAAVPVMKVTVGEELELQAGAVMTNFTSKSLNRTFESVIFSGGPVQGK